MVLDYSAVAVTLPSDFAPASSIEFPDIQANIECGLTLKRVRDMTKTYSQMHRTDKYSEHSLIIDNKIWSMLHHGSLGRVQRILLYLFKYF